MRIKNIRTDQSEQAISLGAALLAAGRVHLQKTARYSIGFLLQDVVGSSKPKLIFGIKYHQVLVPGKPYFLCYPNAVDDSPENRLKFTSLRNNIKIFALGFSDDFNKFSRLKIKDSFIRKLQNAPEEALWYVGFSIDENSIISLHIEPYSSSDNKGKCMDIPLASYGEMFDFSSVEEEDINEF